jgi:hypothetical protein
MEFGSMNRTLLIRKLLVMLGSIGWLIASVASAEIYINEVFFDPGGAGQDNRDEYIELRGTPNKPLANYYLIGVEHENNEANTGGAGRIENIFDLGSLSVPSLGSNGFLLLRQDGNLYDDSSVASGTNSIEEDDGNPVLVLGWGDNNTAPGSSAVGHSGITNAGARSLVLENGGATLMLIHTDGLLAPMLNLDMDNGNNGLDSTTNDSMNWRNHWTIVDSIGHMENDELEFGRMYGKINFAPELVGELIIPEDPLSPVLTPELLAMRTEPGSEYVGLGYEIEILARWGNSTGQTSADWHVSNLTENPGSGSAGVTTTPPVADFRQSGDPHPLDDLNSNTPPSQPATVESNKGVPYGTKLTTTLGAPNYTTGDYNKDGYVNAADYVVWRKTSGQTGNESNHPFADANHDFLVDDADYSSWQKYFGAPGGASGGSGGIANSSTSFVPEPGSWILASFVGMIFPAIRRREQLVR